jgi:chromosome segregation ATPase
MQVQTESKTGKDADADAGASRSAKNLHKDPKALSGGETSFSTICLLMALWDSVHSPIRCLDEFDVFMDATNRQLSMAMLVSPKLMSNAVCRRYQSDGNPFLRVD